MSLIPGGEALIGTDFPYIQLDEEMPLHTRPIKPFHMMSTVVTNEMFATFIDITAYKTDAERIGWSYVFYHQLADDYPETQAPVNTRWWRKVPGASWHSTVGTTKDWDQKKDHPVVPTSATQLS